MILFNFWGGEQKAICTHNDQLPVGLIAQLVEHCTGITEVWVQIPIQAFPVTAESREF